MITEPPIPSLWNVLSYIVGYKEDHFVGSTRKAIPPGPLHRNPKLQVIKIKVSLAHLCLKVGMTLLSYRWLCQNRVWLPLPSPHPDNPCTDMPPPDLTAAARPDHSAHSVDAHPPSCTSSMHCPPWEVQTPGPGDSSGMS